MQTYDKTDKALAINELKGIHLDMLGLTARVSEDNPLDDMLKEYKSLRDRYMKIKDVLSSLSEDSCQHRCDVKLINFELLISFIQSGFDKLEQIIVYLGGEVELDNIKNPENEKKGIKKKIKSFLHKTA